MKAVAAIAVFVTFVAPAAFLACSSEKDDEAPPKDEAALPCTPPSADEGCGTITGEGAFTIRSGIVSGVVQSADDFPRWSITIDLDDRACACASAVAQTCGLREKNLLISVTQPIEAGSDMTGKHRIGRDPTTATGVYMYVGTMLPDGGYQADFPPTDGDFAPGSVDIRVVDGGVVGSFDTVVSHDGGAPAPLSGSFFARSCPDAYVTLDLSP